VGVAFEGGRDGGPRAGGRGGAVGGGVAVVEDVESYRVWGAPRGAGGGVAVVEDVESYRAWGARRGAGGGGAFFLDPPLVVASLFWASRTKVLIKSMFCVITASSMPCD
jgi:hypothetical protein